MLNIEQRYLSEIALGASWKAKFAKGLVGYTPCFQTT